jgi:RNA recognition motif-containing protein
MKRLYVGNLSFDSNEGSVRDAFAAYGQVDSVHLVTDRDTGRPRGFGFVEMSDSGEAQNAIDSLNGTMLDGRSLNVNEARPRPERGAGGGGGFGGGGGRRDRW